MLLLQPGGCLRTMKEASASETTRISVGFIYGDLFSVSFIASCFRYFTGEAERTGH
jgi:hypothetical protein